MIVRALYSLVMHAVRAAVWLAWARRARAEPAWGQRWDERRGRAAAPPDAVGGIVVHAVSMGETLAAVPLVEALLSLPGRPRPTLTCTTPTASALIRQRFGDRVHHVYLPFDTPGATRRFITGWQPQALVLMETELWPNLLQAAADHAVPVVLANARLSQRSARKYARWPRLVQALLEPVDLVLVQTVAERERFLALGLPGPRVHWVGNLKADLPEPPAALVAELRTLVQDRPVFLAASTHEGEERALLTAWRASAAAAAGAAPLLVIAPRHPQRFDEVGRQVLEAGMGLVRRSQGLPPNGSHEVLLVDRMGEVPAWCAVAGIVFVGGSLIERGGHNPLEPAAMGRAVVAGPHVFNFQQAFDRLDAAGATLRPADTQALAGVMRRWRARDPALAPMGARAQEVAQAAGGAIDRAWAVLRPWLDRLPRPRDRALPGELLRHDAARWPVIEPAHFTADWWQREGQATMHGSGRRPVWFVEVGARAWVLRHYWRGGWVGRVLTDRFAPGPRQRSRALAEWRVLARSHALGLAVPRALAARWQRSWPGYRADILVDRIESATDLARLLQDAPLPGEAWQAVGQAIGRLHAHGLWHADLNAHNLLLDAHQRAWVVDFDRARFRPPGPWMRANLARLQRSLHKLQAAGTLHWDPARDWTALEAGWAEGLAAAEAGVSISAR